MDGRATSVSFHPRRELISPPSARLRARGQRGGQSHEFLPPDFQEWQSPRSSGLGDGGKSNAALLGGLAQPEPRAVESQRGGGLFDGEGFQVAVGGNPSAPVWTRVAGGNVDWLEIFAGAFMDEIAHWILQEKGGPRWATHAIWLFRLPLCEVVVPFPIRPAVAALPVYVAIGKVGPKDAAAQAFGAWLFRVAIRWPECCPIHDVGSARV